MVKTSQKRGGFYHFNHTWNFWSRAQVISDSSSDVSRNLKWWWPEALRIILLGDDVDLAGGSRGTSRYMLGASADEFWDTSKGQPLDQPSSQGPCRAGCPKSNPPLGAMWAQLSPQDVFTLGANQGLEFFTEIVERRSFVICSDWHTWKKNDSFLNNTGVVESNHGLIF
jgi:hypothetical protein